MTIDDRTIDDQTIARHEVNAFGGDPRTFERLNADESVSITVLACADGPAAGLTSYGTVGVNRYDNGFTTGDDRPLRVELVGVCDTGYGFFGDVLATVGFAVAAGQISLSPGVILPGVIEVHAPDVTMGHLLLGSPFLWGPDVLDTLEDESMAVAFLQAIPVAQAELEFAREHGVEALEREFERVQIDVYDLDRPSAV